MVASTHTSVYMGRDSSRIYYHLSTIVSLVSKYTEEVSTIYYLNALL
jgi:hypothetical protein